MLRFLLLVSLSLTAAAAAPHEALEAKARALAAPGAGASVLPTMPAIDPQRLPSIAAATAAKLDIALALRVLAAQVRRKKVAARRGERAKVAPNVVVAYVALPMVVARMSDDQKRLAAALAILSLDDRTGLADARNLDGQVDEVRILAAALLDALCGGTRGRIQGPGGLAPRAWVQKVLAKNARIVAAWKAWWPAAAKQAPTDWTIGK